MLKNIIRFRSNENGAFSEIHYFCELKVFRINKIVLLMALVFTSVGASYSQDSLLTELKKVDSIIDVDRGLAEKSIEKIRSKARRDMNKPAIAYSFLTKGNLYFQYQSFDLSLIEYENALELFMELEDTVNIQKAYNNIGAVYTVKEDYLNSLESYLKGYSFVKGNNEIDTKNQTFERIQNYLIILINLGNTYYDMSDFNNAKSFYQKVVEGSEKINDDEMLEKSLYDLATSEIELNELSSAKDHLKKSIEVEESLKSESGLAKKFAAMAKLEYLLNNSVQSEIYLDKSKVELQKGKVLNWGEVGILNDLSELEFYFQNFETAIEYAERAYDLSKELNIEEDRIRALKNMSNAYSKNRQFELAFQAQQELTELKEKKSSNMTSLDVARVEMRLNYEKKMLLDSLEALDQKNKKEREILEVNAENRNRLWVIVALLSLTLILVVSILTLIAFNKKRARNNALLKKSLAEKEVLLKEVHHRVKNNFQVISSLLNLQLSINPSNVEDALKVAQDRILSMALVHRKLYGQQDFEAIEMKGYLEELISTIVESNAVTTSYLVDIKAKGKYVKLDQAIPLGLIFNELITNFFKYVVNEVENAKLSISLEEQGSMLYIEVRDNGKGLPANIDLDNLKTLGLELVDILAEQINAELNLQSDKNGVKIDIKVPIDDK